MLQRESFGNYYLGYEFEKLSSRVRDNWKKIRRISWMDPGIEEIVSDSTRLVLDSSWFKLFLVILTTSLS